MAQCDLGVSSLCNPALSVPNGVSRSGFPSQNVPFASDRKGSLVARGSCIPQALRWKALGLWLRFRPTCRRQLALDRDGPYRLGGRFAFGAVQC